MPALRGIIQAGIKAGQMHKSGLHIQAIARRMIYGKHQRDRKSRMAATHSPISSPVPMEIRRQDESL